MSFEKGSVEPHDNRAKSAVLGVIPNICWRRGVFKHLTLTPLLGSVARKAAGKPPKLEAIKRRRDLRDEWWQFDTIGWTIVFVMLKVDTKQGAGGTSNRSDGLEEDNQIFHCYNGTGYGVAVLNELIAMPLTRLE